MPKPLSEDELDDIRTQAYLDNAQANLDELEEELRRAELQTKNREDLLTRGRVKGFAAMAAGQISHAVTTGVSIPLGTGVVGARRIYKTHHVLSQLHTLIESKGLSGQAKEDAEYICAKKQDKIAKAALSMFPVASTGVTVASLVKAGVKKIRGTHGKHRREVATRILENFKAGDKGYRAIVFALFGNQKNPSYWTGLLETCSDEDLAMKVVAGKIASK